MNTIGVLMGSVVVVILMFLLELPRFRRAEKKRKSDVSRLIRTRNGTSCRVDLFS